jgi:reverse gyrase
MVTVSGSTAKMSEEHFKVYGLIFNRFMASQMVPAVVEEAELSLKLLPSTREFTETLITKVVKDGWNLIEPLKVRELPVKLREGEVYSFPVLSCSKREVPKVYPYTQGELVEEMRRRRIGRPSTYAKIVQTLLDRKYVVQRGRFLYPTKLGIEVYTYLREKFPHYTSEEFTRELEELMDRVERGEADYQEIIRSLKPVLKYAKEALQENPAGE